MFAEHLRFRVRPDQEEAFAAHNRRWLDHLRQQPGFLAQRTLRSEDEAEIWLVIVEWRDRAALAGFPDAVQEELDQAGATVSELLRAEHYTGEGA
jgi:quinol monooxygenase YgiN